MRLRATQAGADAIFLFIAELNGFKSGTPADKLNFGHKCWVNSTLHDLSYNVNQEWIDAINLSDLKPNKKARLIKKEHARAEADRKDAHENIWLQRLYLELDKFYQLDTHLGNIYKKRVADRKQPFTTIVLNPSSTHRWETPIELDASALT